MPRIRRKWRPALWQVVWGALLGTLGLSFLGLVALRYLGPEIGFRAGAAIIGGIILIATLVLAFLLSRLLLRPVSALARRAGELRRDPMARVEPLAHYGTQELCDLGESVLDMAGRLQAREATIRSFTDHVTHEMKTPISAVRAAVEMLEEAELDETALGLVATIAEAGAQMERQLQALRAAAAAREPGHHGSSRLSDVVPGLAASHPGLELSVAGGEVTLPLDAAGLGIVLQQLVSNAAAAGAGTVRLTAAPGRLQVEDDGRGISEGNRAHFFKPFFTTRRDSGGTGMGLTIAATLLAAHGAEIGLLRPTAGAAFEILFPASDEKTDPPRRVALPRRRPAASDR
jgi:two-component system, OmpR family, sensor kinase